MNQRINSVTLNIKYCIAHAIILICLLFTAHTSVSQNLLTENTGQLPSIVNYHKTLSNGFLYYKAKGFTTLLRNNNQYDSLWEHFHFNKKLKKEFKVNFHRFDVNFENANMADIENKYPNVTNYNFFIGKEAKNWATNVKTYHEIIYHNIYSNINLQVQNYGKDVKHNYVLKPQAAAEQIILRYSFTNKIELLNNQLIIRTSVGKVVEQKPITFQIINGDSVFIDCKYILKKDKEDYLVSFKLSTYNKNYDLVIDPILVFSTYSGSAGDNFGFTATHDSRANLYSAGIVDGAQGIFPVTAGAFQMVYGGSSSAGRAPANLKCDIGINKYDSAGTRLLYSTYLGGNDDEYPHSIVVDNSDNLLVMGTAYSRNFPLDSFGYDTSFNGNTDIFIVKLSRLGDKLLAGTFIGGNDFDGLNTRSLRYNYADDFRGDIVVDSADNIYVASTTYSNNFPQKKAFQAFKGSTQEGCIFSFEKTLKTLRFSSFAGGNDDDACYSVRLFDSFVYVGGGTASSFMNFNLNGAKNTYGGKRDGFIIKLKNTGEFRNSSYFGTNEYDQVHFLDIDENGQVYAAGQTEGLVTRTPGTYGTDNTSQFIIRMSPNLANVNLSTTFGNRLNNPEISPSAFLVDKCENIYFSGWGSPITDGTLHRLTTDKLPVTSGAIQSITDKSDFYLLVLNKNAKSLLYATYFGGNKTEDHVDGGTSRFDKKGVVYQSVCASCPDGGGNQDFPTTTGAPFTSNPSPRCSNASFKIDFQITFIVDAKFIANPVKGCGPLKVTFTNQSKKARQQVWDFGDGSPKDTARNPVHTFTKKGKYIVKLKSIDSFSCNISENDSLEIEVLESPIADFQYEGDVCNSKVKFTNQSSNYKNPEWNFGDSGNAITKEENPTHLYQKDGRFTVLLKVEHPTSGCIDTQTAVIQIFSDPSKSLKIPNVFTPNADNLNDCYTIDGVDLACDNVKCWIYDRWGILVFEGKLLEKCWNGRLQNSGPLMPDGVYYYLMTIERKNTKEGNKTIKVNGVIHLLKG